MTARPPFTTLPPNPEKWIDAARLAGVGSTSLLGFNKHKSASKVTREQYLTFRTLAIAYERNDFLATQWNFVEKLQVAIQEPANSEAFQTFLGAMRDPLTLPTGDFSQILSLHSEIVRNKDAHFPLKLQTHDETPVNVSLICLLQAIAAVSPDPLSAMAPYESQVRGDSIVSHEVRALVECKKGPRKAHDLAATMQEAALFVAWIREYPGGPNLYEFTEMVQTLSQRGLYLKAEVPRWVCQALWGRRVNFFKGHLTCNLNLRVLVSQDRMELYVTLADTPLEWREYLIRYRTSTNLGA
ncbi:uncharacterized protein BJX67DRAFT_385854 [Aspergillus lucknowensis]|uniref:Uncharacterized protein n=1 Tax=Aspergillus lucknowensis TaxID=176173 RepID=A0ABR4LDM6_9EURO